MTTYLDDQDWQQHYPTYRFKERDIVIAEYEQAATSLEAEERVFANSANVALLAATILGSLALGRLKDLYAATSDFLSVETVYLGLCAATLAFSFFGLRYFADRQKALLFAKRKLVVLRRMLGLSYGHMQLVLPGWRVEGASQPFAIRLFPGWMSYVAYPFWVLALFGSGSIYFFTAHFLGTTYWRFCLSGSTAEALGAIPATLCLTGLAGVYRSALFDTHERWTLLWAKGIARVLRVRLVSDFEYVLYRAKLAVAEATRLRVPLDRIHPILMFVEDRHFRDHHGVSIRGMARAVRDRLQSRRLSGGSAITQQLARTLFIEDYRKLYRRKVVEIWLALWLDRVLDKNSQLDCYLCSVRYAEGVFGIVAASHHFLGAARERISVPEAFVLLERVGNIRARLLLGRIDVLLSSSLKAGVLSSAEISTTISLYELLLRDAALSVDDPTGFDRLSAKHLTGSA